MQKHTHNVTNIKANDYINVGQHSTIYKHGSGEGFRLGDEMVRSTGGDPD